MNKPSTFAFAFALAVATLAGCDDSHTRDTDSGLDAPSTLRDTNPRLGETGTLDASCAGGLCACPPGINPWDPRAPGSRCSVEGAECGSNGGICGGALSCTCTAGQWQCRVAEPDPACRCGRQPTLGSPCVDDGMTCGACCPVAGEWPLLECVEGRWAPGACPAIVCPDRGCPVDRAAAVGTSCPNPGRLCGNACCSTPIQCAPDSGRWVALPEADCICAQPDFACGSGTCTADQACVGECSPSDGIDYSCQGPREGCTGCGCYTDPSVLCEVRDGHVFVRPTGFCG